MLSSPALHWRMARPLQSFELPAKQTALLLLAYVSLCMDNPAGALAAAVDLLAMPELPGDAQRRCGLRRAARERVGSWARALGTHAAQSAARRLLAHTYCAEALCHLDRPAEAGRHLLPLLTSMQQQASAGASEARAALYLNLATVHVLQVRVKVVMAAVRASLTRCSPTGRDLASGSVRVPGPGQLAGAAAGAPPPRLPAPASPRREGRAGHLEAPARLHPPRLCTAGHAVHRRRSRRRRCGTQRPGDVRGHGASLLGACACGAARRRHCGLQQSSVTMRQRHATLHVPAPLNAAASRSVTQRHAASHASPHCSVACLPQRLVHHASSTIHWRRARRSSHDGQQRTLCPPRGPCRLNATCCGAGTADTRAAHHVVGIRASLPPPPATPAPPPPP